MLFITAYVPNETGAGMKFTHSLLKRLSSVYQVDLIYFRQSKERPYKPIGKVNVLMEVPISTRTKAVSAVRSIRTYPIFSVRDMPRVRKLVGDVISSGEYDLMFLDHSQVFAYGEAFPDIPKILMSHDVECQRVDRAGGGWKVRWVRKTERRLLSQPNSHIFTFSDKDRQIIKEEYGLESCVTAGHVDEMAYASWPGKITDEYVFFGLWSRPDNYEGLEWFIDKVYPWVPEKYSFKIIGRGLPDRILERISGDARIKYMGFVENPYETISNSRALLSPLFTGAGVKFKVLEALGCGTPVIGTRISFEGISDKYSEFMVAADSAEEFLKRMEGLNYSIEDRVSFKRHFMDTYEEGQLAGYIRQILEK